MTSQVNARGATLCLVAGALAVMAGCGEPPMEGDEPPMEHERVTQAFQNWLGYENCGAAQQAKLARAANILSDRIYRNGGRDMRACLSDAFISNPDRGVSAEEIWQQLTTPGRTVIECTDSLTEECAGKHEWAGCASIGIGGERLSIANHYLLDPNVSEAELAGVITHELMHNRGHRHSGLGAEEYSLTVPEQARACVARGEPNGARRSAIPGEADLAPAGRFGGVPFRIRCASNAFASGLVVGLGDQVESLGLECNLGADSSVVGNDQPARVARQRCAAGEVVVGVHGRSNEVVTQLGAICAPATDLTARRKLSTLGDDRGVSFERVCPAGMAVRRIRGRSASLVDQVQLECHQYGSVDDHQAHAVDGWVGGTGGSEQLMRCSGKSAARALLGRYEARVDRLSLKCAGVGTGVPEHIVPFVGGNGATTQFRRQCASGERIVGLRVRSGTVVDAVSPLCASASGWLAATASPYAVGWAGGDGGNYAELRCPTREFLTGFGLRSGNVIDGLRIHCRDLR